MNAEYHRNVSKAEPSSRLIPRRLATNLQLLMLCNATVCMQRLQRLMNFKCVVTYKMKGSSVQVCWSSFI